MCHRLDFCLCVCQYIFREYFLLTKAPIMEQQFLALFGKGGAYEMMYKIFLSELSSLLLRKKAPHNLFLGLDEPEKQN